MIRRIIFIITFLFIGTFAKGQILSSNKIYDLKSSERIQNCTLKFVFDVQENKALLLIGDYYYEFLDIVDCYSEPSGGRLWVVKNKFGQEYKIIVAVEKSNNVLFLTIEYYQILAYNVELLIADDIRIKKNATKQH